MTHNESPTFATAVIEQSIGMSAALGLIQSAYRARGSALIILDVGPTLTNKLRTSSKT